MAAKIHAVLVHGAQRRQREHLEAAAVGEDRAVPVHEAVQATHVAHELVARSQVQMIRVRQDHLGSGSLEVLRIQRLHRRQRAHRHECRCLDGAVRRDEQAATGRAFRVFERELKAHQMIAIASPYEKKR